MIHSETFAIQDIFHHKVRKSIDVTRGSENFQFSLEKSNIKENYKYKL